MDRIEAIVPIELLDVVILGVAVPAVHLYREIVRRHAPPGGPALGHRREQIEQSAGPLGLARRGCARFVNEERGEQHKCECALDEAGSGSLVAAQRQQLLELVDDEHSGRMVVEVRAVERANGIVPRSDDGDVAEAWCEAGQCE